MNHFWNARPFAYQPWNVRTTGYGRLASYVDGPQTWKVRPLRVSYEVPRGDAVAMPHPPLAPARVEVAVVAVEVVAVGVGDDVGTGMGGGAGSSRFPQARPKR